MGFTVTVLICGHRALIMSTSPFASLPQALFSFHDSPSSTFKPFLFIYLSIYFYLFQFPHKRENVILVILGPSFLN
jgi:hypothetical protein